jgi:site-specific DNA recombinase
MRQKALRGWNPRSILPLGYMHTPLKRLGDEEIVVDPERFEIVTSMLKKIAYGELTPPEALQFVRQMGLKTRKGQLLPETTFYRMLETPFYYGEYEYPKGQVHMGKHFKAITKEEYELIQIQLGRKNRPKKRKHFSPYAGLMQCGICGCSLVADRHVKVQKNGNINKFIYYRCSQAKGNCHQKYLNSKKLEEQFNQVLDSITISDAFHEWAVEELKLSQQKEIQERSEVIMISRRGYDEITRKMDDLLTAYLNKKVPEDIYTRKMGELEKEQKVFKSMLDNTDNRIKEWTQKAEYIFDFARNAKERFNDGDAIAKRDIIANMAAKIVLKDSQITVQIDAPLEIIQTAKGKVSEFERKLEPQKSLKNRENFKKSLSKNTIWGG